MALRPLSLPEGGRPLACPLAVVGDGPTPSRPSLLGRIGRARPIGAGAAGFTLVETMMVVALVMVVSGIAIPISRNMIARSKAKSSTMEMLTWFESARNRAAAERRNFEITVNSTQRTITVERVESSGAKTPILVRQLPETVGFVQYSGVGDTPDGFGATSPIQFSGPAPYMFTSEGMFVDANGDPINGTFFMGKPGQPDTGTALTVFGTTGLLRAWKLAGKQWLR